MKHKVSELTGRLLDAAVARAEGLILCESGSSMWVRDQAGNVMGYITDDFMPAYSPSKLWQQGGPIIEREGISLFRDDQEIMGGKFWEAGLPINDTSSRCYTGPTPLIAAMRCYVQSKYGDEVELP